MSKHDLDDVMRRFHDRKEKPDKVARPPTELVDTGLKLRVKGKERPVLKLGERFFVGEALHLRPIFVCSGQVWSARNLQDLEYNVNFGRIYDPKRDSGARRLQGQDVEDGGGQEH